MPQSPEMETIDQLLCGEMRLSVIRQLYDADQAFLDGIYGLLVHGDVRLYDEAHAEVPQWRWRLLFEAGEALTKLPDLLLEVMEAGA